MDIEEIKKENRLYSLMDNIGTFLVITFIAFIVGMIFGMDIVEKRTRVALNGVGIQSIVKCNNTQSNWYEIVWYNK